MAGSLAPLSLSINKGREWRGGRGGLRRKENKTWETTTKANWQYLANKQSKKEIKMDINELKEKKEALEFSIAGQLMDFITNTGINIEEVHCTMITANKWDGLIRQSGVRVRVILVI